jgi:hypothetical protein
VQGSHGSQNTLTEDQARLTATAIIDHGTSLRPVVDRMLLIGGVLDTNSPAGSGILFDAPGAGVAPLTREVFESTGGGAAYPLPPPEACVATCSYTFTGQYTMTDAGTSSPELAMLLINIPQKVCQMLNVVLGLGTTIPTGDPLTTVAAFDGTNYGAATAITLASYSPRAVCYQESGGAARYIYVNIIRAR